MDFDFSDDQQQLRDAVAKWVEKGYGFERRQAIEGRRLLARSLGRTGRTRPGRPVHPRGRRRHGHGPGRGHGGDGRAGPRHRARADGPGLHRRRRARRPRRRRAKDNWLPRIAGGQALVVLAYQERKARYRLDVCEAKATKAGDGWTVSGTKSLVAAGDEADAYLVPAQPTARSPCSWSSAPPAASRRGARHARWRPRRRSRVRQRRRDAHRRRGLPVLEHAVDIGIAALCAEAVGVMDKTLAVTVEYMNTRKQFGVASPPSRPCAIARPT